MANIMIVRNDNQEDKMTTFTYLDIVDDESEIAESVLLDLAAYIMGGDGYDHVSGPENGTYSLWSGRHDALNCVSWWTLDLGDDPYAIIKTITLEGGGVESFVVGHAKTRGEASYKVEELYNDELANPSFYAGWDPEYCVLDEDHAELSVETMDSVVNIVIADTVHKAVSWVYFEHLS